MLGEWSHHPGYLVHEDLFLYRSSVYPCHLFLISSISVKSIQLSVLYCSHLCMKCSLVISNFFEEISSNSHSTVFLYLHWSRRKAFLYLLAIFWDSAFKWVYLSFSPLPLDSLLFSAIRKASPDNRSAFWHFFFLGMVLITASCTMSWNSVHSSSGTLSDLIANIHWIIEKSREFKKKNLFLLYWLR